MKGSEKCIQNVDREDLQGRGYVMDRDQMEEPEGTLWLV
jgi:hypothetical protein